MRSINLFNANAASDGTTTGASESYSTVDREAYLVLLNAGGAAVEVQSRSTANPTAAWATIATNVKNGAVGRMRMLSGNEYRFNITTAGSSAVDASFHPITDNMFFDTAIDGYLFGMSDTIGGIADRSGAASSPGNAALPSGVLRVYNPDDAYALGDFVLDPSDGNIYKVVGSDTETLSPSQDVTEANFARTSGTRQITAPIGLVGSTLTSVVIDTNDGEDYTIDWDGGTTVTTHASGATASHTYGSAYTGNAVIKMNPDQWPTFVNFSAGDWVVTGAQYKRLNIYGKVVDLRVTDGYSTGLLSDFAPPDTKMNRLDLRGAQTDVSGDLADLSRAGSDTFNYVSLVGVGTITGDINTLLANLSAISTFIIDDDGTGFTLGGDIEQASDISVFRLLGDSMLLTGDLAAATALWPNVIRIDFRGDAMDFDVSTLVTMRSTAQQFYVDANLTEVEVGLCLEGLAANVTTWNGLSSITLSGTNEVPPATSTNTGGFIDDIEGTTGTPTVTVNHRLAYNASLSATAADNMSVRIDTHGGGDFTIDWDGGTTVTTYSSGATATHTYGSSYTGPVEFQFLEDQAPTRLHISGTSDFSFDGTEYEAFNVHNLVDHLQITGPSTVSGDLSEYVKAGAPLNRLYLGGQNLAITGDLNVAFANAPNIDFLYLLGNSLDLTGDLDVMCAGLNAPGLAYLLVSASQVAITGNLAEFTKFTPDIVRIQFSGAMVDVEGDVEAMGKNTPLLNFFSIISNLAAVSGSVSEMAKHTPLLTDIRLDGELMAVGGDLAALMEPLPVIDFLELNGVNISVSLSEKMVVPTTFTDFHVTTDGLTEAEVDFVLEGLTDVTTWNSPRTVDLTGLNEPPGVASTTAVTGFIQQILDNGATTVSVNS